MESIIRIRRCGLLALAALAIGLVACEEAMEKPDVQKPGTEKPPEPQKPEPVVLSGGHAQLLATPEQAQLLVLPLLNMLNSPASFASGQAGFLPAAAAVRDQGAARLVAAQEPPAVCVTSVPEFPVDGDRDGIPLAVRIVFDCADAFAGYAFSGAGTVVVTDEDDTNPASGFSADIDAQYAISGPDIGAIVFVLDVTLDVSYIAASGYDISYDGTISYETSAGSYQLSYDVNVVHEGSSFAAGVISMNGTFGYSWDWDCSMATGAFAEQCQSQVQFIGSSGDIHLTIQATRLEYDTASCPTAVTSGTVEVRDSADNVARVQYTGCGQATSTYNGEPLE